MNTIMQMVDRIRDTAESHDRCAVVEVMGRGAGYLALTAGVACGATSTLIPEVPYDFDRDVIERMKRTQKSGKVHFVILVFCCLRVSDCKFTIFLCICVCVSY